MRVFVTGATGFIGSALVRELIGAGHQVLGLCRNEAKAAALAAAGAAVLRGSLDDLDILRQGAAQCDGAINLAFNHEAFNDFARFAESGQQEQRAIEAIGSALSGSGRPFVLTSGTGLLSPGQLATEQAKLPPGGLALPRNPEAAGAALAAQGVNVCIVRLPQVHDTHRQGLVSRCIAIALEKRFLAYVGAGLNRWPAAHRRDVVRLYRLALERAHSGAVYHAVGEQGVALRDIANTRGTRLEMPVKSLTTQDAEGYFGWLGAFAAADIPASSDWTQRSLDWHPSGPGLLADLERLELPPA
jgi:nucleoside-diphosphate-sugar epimerase